MVRDAKSIFWSPVRLKEDVHEAAKNLSHKNEPSRSCSLPPSLSLIHTHLGSAERRLRHMPILAGQTHLLITFTHTHIAWLTCRKKNQRKKDKNGDLKYVHIFTLHLNHTCTTTTATTTRLNSWRYFAFFFSIAASVVASTFAKLVFPLSCNNVSTRAYNNGTCSIWLF